MNDMAMPTVTATPEGGAELRLVVRLDWERVAELGRLASELASELNRPITLDEAVSHQLASPARPKAVAPGAIAAGTPVMPLPGAAAEPPRPAPVAAAKQAVPASLESGPSARPAAVAAPARPATAPAQTAERDSYPLAAAG